MHKCAVVPETELEVVKRSLATVTSCHIFSVQKAKLKVRQFFYSNINKTKCQFFFGTEKVIMQEKLDLGTYLETFETLFLLKALRSSIM